MWTHANRDRKQATKRRTHERADTKAHTKAQHQRKTQPTTDTLPWSQHTGGSLLRAPVRMPYLRYLASIARPAPGIGYILRRMLNGMAALMSG